MTKSEIEIPETEKFPKDVAKVIDFVSFVSALTGEEGELGDDWDHYAWTDNGEAWLSVFPDSALLDMRHKHGYIILGYCNYHNIPLGWM